MGILESITAILLALAGLFGFLYKREIKKNAILEKDSELAKRTIDAAIKQQNVLVEGGEREQEVIEKAKAELQEGVRNGEINPDDILGMLNGVRDKHKH